jgi:LmbE family N-acetylglucosaminyl deacetylase
MNVLVVAPHPDDEAIGCGGTICWHVARGDRVEVLFVTSGEAGVPKDMTTDLQEAKAIRQREAGQASYCLHTSELFMLGLKDGAVPPKDQRLALSIAERVKWSSIGRIYAPSELDSHPDHVAVRQAITLLREVVVTELWEYEIWSPHTNPNEIVDITPFVTAKRAAIRGYKSQLANDFESAILALNHYRGLLNAGGSGVMYAEAFHRV